MMETNTKGEQKFSPPILTHLVAESTHPKKNCFYFFFKDEKKKKKTFQRFSKTDDYNFKKISISKEGKINFQEWSRTNGIIFKRLR